MSIDTVIAPLERDDNVQHYADIARLVSDYFRGLHNSDVALLDSVFDEQAMLYAPGIRRSKAQWLTLVANRPIPKQRGDAFAYQILAVEVLGQQAMVKVSCPLLGEHFIDYLGLLFEQGRWRIVAKQYATQPLLGKPCFAS